MPAERERERERERGRERERFYAFCQYELRCPVNIFKNFCFVFNE